MSFALGWNLFRLVAWCSIAIWAQPHVLDWIDGGRVAGWLSQHRWAWWLGAPPLGVLAFLSVLEPLNAPEQRASAQALAEKLGATLIHPRGLDPAYGIRQGPGLRMPIGRWTLDVASWKRETKAQTVARVRIESASTLSFVARSSKREPAALRGLLSNEPLRTGVPVLDEKVVLRSNQPESARALLTSPAVTSALMALDAATRSWDWALFPESSGAAELTASFRGAADEASLRAVRSLLEAALEHLAEHGALAA